MKPRAIWCCGCGMFVQARLTDGKEIYPNRPDLARLNFWCCDTCHNYVGCHHKMRTNPTRPLGVIPTPELRRARFEIHALIDPLWQRGKMSRDTLYNHLSLVVGRSYHTADLRTLDEARAVYREGQRLVRAHTPLTHRNA